MKNKFLKYTLSAAIIGLSLSSCADDDKLPVDFEELNRNGGPFAAELSTEGSTNINREDAAASEFTKSYILDSNEDGMDISKVDVYVGFSGDQLDVPEVLYKTVESSAFDTSVTQKPQLSVDFNGGEILSALGLTPDQLEGGDTFDFRLALTTPEGTFSDVSPNFDNQSADHTFSSSVVCILAVPISGDYVLDMKDSYGDGWNGALLTVIIDGESTEYFAEGSGSIETVTVPDGAMSLEFVYSTGDFEEENSFTIFAPSGNNIAEYGPNPPAGPVALNLCNE